MRKNIISNLKRLRIISIELSDLALIFVLQKWGNKRGLWLSFEYTPQ